MGTDETAGMAGTHVRCEWRAGSRGRSDAQCEGCCSATFSGLLLVLVAVLAIACHLARVFHTCGAYLPSFSSRSAISSAQHDCVRICHNFFDSGGILRPQYFDNKTYVRKRRNLERMRNLYTQTNLSENRAAGRTKGGPAAWRFTRQYVASRLVRLWRNYSMIRQ